MQNIYFITQIENKNLFEQNKFPARRNFFFFLCKIKNLIHSYVTFSEESFSMCSLT